VNWTNKRVLVTGAGGFIGSHLAEALVEAGAKTRAFVLYNSLGSREWLDISPLASEMEIFSGDICDNSTVAASMKGIDIVFHLAAMIAIPYSYIAPRSYVQTNILGTLNVLQSARESGVTRVVHTSTSEVYGTAQKVPIDESHPLRGQSPYSASKIGADKMAEAFGCSYQLPIVTIRPFNTYGPRQSSRAVIPTIISQCLSDNIITLGNISSTRDFTFVTDTVRGFLAAAEVPSAIGQTINLGVGREISIENLTQKIARLIKANVQIVADTRRFRPSDSEVDRLLSDNTKALTILGWQPETSLHQGLQATIQWVQENSEKFKTNEYVI
tara:strand:- start:1854 stop:2837 length:984 start_codon:yes stop_codon:yes gene_type:complete